MSNSAFSVSVVRSVPGARKLFRGCTSRPSGYDLLLQRDGQSQRIAIHRSAIKVGQIDVINTLVLHIERGNGPFVFLPEEGKTISVSFPVKSLEANGNFLSCRFMEGVVLPVEAISDEVESLRAKFVEKQQRELTACRGWLAPSLEQSGYFIYQVSANVRYHPAMTFFLLGEQETRGVSELRSRVLAELDYNRETGKVRFRRKRDKSRKGYQSCALASFLGLLKHWDNAASSVLSPIGMDGMDSLIARELLVAR